MILFAWLSKFYTAHLLLSTTLVLESKRKSRKEKEKAEEANVKAKSPKKSKTLPPLPSSPMSNASQSDETEILNYQKEQQTRMTAPPNSLPSDDDDSTGLLESPVQKVHLRL